MRDTPVAELEIDFCILNGENAADGIGITPRLAEQLLAAGADAITLGNHTWRRTEIAPYLATSNRVIRPANFAAALPAAASPSSLRATARPSP